MNKENNIIIPSFSFSIKDYLQIFNISSLESFNNFMKTRLSSDMSHLTVYRVFTYSMLEYQKSIINSPDLAMNIIKTFLKIVFIIYSIKNIPPYLVHLTSLIIELTIIIIFSYKLLIKPPSIYALKFFMIINQNEIQNILDNIFYIFWALFLTKIYKCLLHVPILSIFHL